MNTDKSANALKKVAANNGSSVEDVKYEIQAAIDFAMKNPDPEIKKFWDSIPKKGKTPTPEEVIAYLADKISNS